MYSIVESYNHRYVESRHAQHSERGRASRLLTKLLYRPERPLSIVPEPAVRSPDVPQSAVAVRLGCSLATLKPCTTPEDLEFS